MTRRRLASGALGLFVVLACTAAFGAQAASAAFPLDSYTNVVFSDGFESGSLSSWDVAGGNGSVAASGAAAHAGTFGARMTNASGQFGILIKRLAAPAPDSSVSFWVRVAAGSGLQTVAQARDDSSSQTMWALLYDQSRNAFYFYPFQGSGATEVFTGTGSAPEPWNG